MSNSSENDENRLRAGGDVGVRESDHPILDTESGGESAIEKETGDENSIVTGRGSVGETENETEAEKEGEDSGETDREEEEKRRGRESDKESMLESGKEGDIETGSDGSARDSSLERHCEDYLAKKIGECLLV